MPVHGEAKYGRILYFSYHVHRDPLSGKQMPERHELLDVCVCECEMSKQVEIFLP